MQGLMCLLDKEYWLARKCYGWCRPAVIAAKSAMA